MIVVRSRPPRRRWPYLLLGGALLCLLSGTIALAASSALTQKPGIAGCISDDSSGGECADGKALSGAVDIAVSPDGKSAYAAAINGTVAIFDRNTATGALTQKAGTAGCVSEDGLGGACTDGRGMTNPESVRVSPDGTSVYVATSGFSGGVAIFDRNTATGALTQKAGSAGCITADGSSGACRVGSGITSSAGVAISPDGKSVYLVAQLTGSAVAIFDRDPTTGALNQKAGKAGCISEDGTGGACKDGKALVDATTVVVSPDGANVYVASGTSDAVAIFNRDAGGALTQKPGTTGCISMNGTAGTCADGAALNGASGVAISPGGTSVYVASALSDAIAIFDRDPANGALTQKAGQAGCISKDGTGGNCLDGSGLNGAFSVAVSPGGASVYDGAVYGDAVGAFNRSANGTLSQPAGKAGCISEDTNNGNCADGRGLNGTFNVTVSPDGGNVYAASYYGNAISIFDRQGGTTPPAGGGGGGGGGGPADTTPPELRIDKKPKRKLETRRKKVEVKVKFSSEDGASFTCKLDGKDAKSCHSPYKAKLTVGKRKPEKHKIKIVATDAAGNASEAETVKVKVVRKRGKR